ncbi:UbiD family decarboxylase domain-containing protein [Kineobactrum salinum]|uniref:3-octaprenyl-4-hydroxybenzoate carboxy-lyase-like N-terminal domain-containing protein n=1 Tax=Kineobactrum salinum TaxID=2708301 RepID=A0A6C0UAW4_9GAMM|nr:UbiD family decarboxylase domain-containing protein [Kineobactrum salinum]QIB67064.1 hypothetical protein G3T16_18365 [Kineobactrum salinum]
MKRFVEKILADNQMSIVDRRVAPEFELAAVTRAVQDAGDNAVLFAEVANTDFSVVSNLYGSHARLCELIGAPWTVSASVGARFWMARGWRTSIAKKQCRTTWCGER